MKLLVTGGAGFIGSALIRHIMERSSHDVLNIDKLSYAADTHSLAVVETNPCYRFQHADICNSSALDAAFTSYQPDAVIHLAGETHVDRSIDDPEGFTSNNVLGTQTLLQSCLDYFQRLPVDRQRAFRFLDVSTEEVYGGRSGDEYVNEAAPYQPGSPYASSKAAASHLCRTYCNTFHLPVLTTYSSNNYGPWQHEEKLVPRVITRAIAGEPIPVYGSGEQCRNWLYVEDHVRALLQVLEQGKPGRGYNIAGNLELPNLALVQQLCDRLDRVHPRDNQSSYKSLITFVEDRPGHDQRYGLDDHRIRQELQWQPQIDLVEGLKRTVDWYLNR